MDIKTSRYLIENLDKPALLNAQREWLSFREGVDISLIYEEADKGCSAAFLRYAPGSSVPKHQHIGFEHILILDGEQSDENGVYSAGMLLVHAKESTHQVSSEKGCIALAIWQHPVEFI